MMLIYVVLIQLLIKKMLIMIQEASKATKKQPRSAWLMKPYISTALISDALLFAYFCLLFLSLCPCLCAQGCCLLVMPSTAHHTT